jgi:hypothetical protein
MTGGAASANSADAANASGYPTTAIRAPNAGGMPAIVTIWPV